jgi:hypothetical protein
MASLKEMKGIRPKIESLLKERPHLRDDDNKLIANIWHSEVPTLEDISGLKFLKLFSEGELTSPESIRRMRQKIQEENKDYRGDNYAARHKEEKTVREGIKDS